ncbi:MAG: hypothetical protein WC804_10920 [Sphingomonas sp.]|uniref:hypothetical protein n=1 Tax=Sphingomonas sp. TaxID=28214 RepID=UPI003566C708
MEADLRRLAGAGLVIGTAHDIGRGQLSYHGFCVLTGIFDPAETERMRAMLDEFGRKANFKDLRGRGVGIHPLLEKIPGFLAFLCDPRLLSAMEQLLGAPVRLMKSGARMSDHHCDAQLALWHNHFHWDPGLLLHRRRVERVLAVIYIDGSGPDLPAYFVAWPRSLNDPLRSCPDQTAEVETVAMQPGDVVVFDTALWHSAWRGTGIGRRRIAGGHYQLAICDRPHPDDDGSLAKAEACADGR